MRDSTACFPPRQPMPEKMKDSTERDLSVPERLFRLILKILPSSFRSSYAAEILSYHRSQMEESGGSILSKTRLWCLACWDVVLNGLLERGYQTLENVSRRRKERAGSPRQSAMRRLCGCLSKLSFFDHTAVRRLRKSPRFTVVTVLTLGLGIGANTALFSVVHSVLLNPLPYDDSERIVFAWETRGENLRQQPVSLGNFRQWRSEAEAFQSLAAARVRPYNLTGRDTPLRASGLETSAALLSLLGTTPAYGREFSLEDELPGSEPVCIVSYAFWRDVLGANPDLTDFHLTLNGTSHTVVGVMPAGLAIPRFGIRSILTPLPLDPVHLGFWSNHNTTVYGRLRTDVRIEQASQELSVIASRLAEAHTEWNEGIGTVLVPAREWLVQGASRTLWILLATVGFVLLIACVNVASLLLARAVAAEREMAVRVALGALRSRIVSLVLSEALLLAGAGGLLGLATGYWGVEAIRRWGPANLPRLSEVEISVPVLLFTMGCVVFTGVLFGLIPAVRSMRVDVQSTLNKSGRSPGMGSSHKLQRTFVVAEVAIAVVLLTCSGLLLKTFSNLLKVNPGYQSEGRIATQLNLPSSRYPDQVSVAQFLDELHSTLDATPGIEVSGSSVGLPFQNDMWRKYLTLEHRQALTLPEIPVIDVSISTPGYVRTLGIPLVEGRELEASDDAESPFVALVSEEFVRTHLQGEEVIGKRLCLAAPDHLLPPEHIGLDPWYTIVGIVGDVRRWSLRSTPLPEVYISQRQDLDNAHGFFVVANTALSNEASAEVFRQIVWDIDPELPVAWVRPIDTMLSNAVAQPRFNATLVAAFGLAALFLALIGVYGLLANAVAERTQEIGVRIALGARPGQILRHVAGQGITTAAVGIAIGIAVSATATRLMAALLFGIDPIDASTFLSVIEAVLVVASLAASIPSWRAARLNANEALRAE